MTPAQRREIAWLAVSTAFALAAGALAWFVNPWLALTAMVGAMFASDRAFLFHGRRTATDDQIEQRALEEVAAELSADAKRWRARGHRQRADEFLMAAVRMRYAAEKRRHRATTTTETEE
jgi:hypothetical protein